MPVLIFRPCPFNIYHKVNYLMNLDANKLKADILSDMRVELSDEFDRNFERKAFFSDKWKPRAHDYPPRLPAHRDQ